MAELANFQHNHRFMKFIKYFECFLVIIEVVGCYNLDPKRNDVGYFHVKAIECRFQTYFYQFSVKLVSWLE